MSFFGELRRRNVVKVAVAYAIVGWLLVEVSSTVFPIVELPEWTVTFVTVLVLLRVSELVLRRVNILIHGEETPMRSYVLAALLLLSPGLCVAQLEQIDVAPDCLVGSRILTAPPLIRESVSTQFAEVRTCLVNADSDCAESALDAIDSDPLNDDERAVLALIQGDTEKFQGSSRRARREYGKALDAPGVSRQVVRVAIERLALLHVDDGDPEDALEQLEALECGDWTPNLLYLQAVAEFGLRNFEAAQVSVQNAIDSQQALGVDVPTDWHSLQASAVSSAEAAADDDVICVREASTGSRIPTERCTTRAQREREAWEASEWVLSGGDFGGVVEVQTIN